MKILFVNPPRFNKIPVIREIRCAGFSPGSVYPPLKLAYTAGFLRDNGFEVSIIDANAENYEWDDVKKMAEKFLPDIVIFSSSPSTMAFDSQTAKVCKEINQNIITVLDDTHISPVMPEKVLNTFKDIDVLINTGSEFTALEVCKNPKNLEKIEGIAFRKNQRIVNNLPRKELNIEKQSLPAYDLLPFRKYTSISTSRKKPFAAIITSSGCPFNCSFCVIGGATVIRGYGPKWQAKTPEKTLKEIEYLIDNFGIKSLYFFDETFTVDKERVKKICQLILDKKIKIEWACNSRVDTIDEELIKLMKKTGCWKICFGVESGSQKILDLASKKTLLEDTKRIFDTAKKIGVCATASTMIGLPGENKETLKETLKFIKSLKPYRAQIVITIPYPGTRLYDDVKGRGFLEKDYSFIGYDAYGVCGEPVLRTEELSSADLKNEQKKMIFKLYLTPGIFLRTLKNIKSFSYINNLLKALKELMK
jgi:anaerobic magnesium-protoporphyrin IX monomethyl ester cyclase